jgi:O-antigen ligase
LSIRASKLLDWSAKIFAVVVFFLATNGLVRLLQYPSGTVEAVDHAGDPVTQVMWLGFYGATFLLILVHWDRFVNVALSDPLLLLLVGIVVASVLWSAAPTVTLREDVAFVGTTMIGAYLAARHGPGELLRLLAWALGIGALLSLVFGLALPSYGLDPADLDGAWQGIYSGGKNELGRNMALSSMVFLLLALGARRYRWVAWLGFGLSVGLLLLSDSVTSLVTFLIVLVLLTAGMALRWPYTLAVPGFVLLLAGSALATMWFAGNMESVFGAFGRDSTLTGRTLLWPAIVEMIWQRPWLGYGYGAFWLGWEGESSQVWHWTFGIEPVHAHNGFLDLCLHVGLLGVSIFALGFLAGFRRAVSWARATTTWEGLWPLAFLSFILVYNVAESSLLANNSILWLLYVVTVVSTVVRPSEAAMAERTAPKDRSLMVSQGGGSGS